MNRLKTLYRRIREMRRCSPGGFLLWAAMLLILFGVVHAAGFREYAAILSGTPAQGPFPPVLTQFFAAAYIVLYVAAVVLAPILVVGAGLFHALERWLPSAPRRPMG